MRIRTTPPSFENIDPAGTLFDPANLPVEDTATMSQESETDIRLDNETDKLGSVAAAAVRLGLPNREPHIQEFPRRSWGTEAKKRRRAGRRRVELSGRDISRQMANQAALDSEPRNLEEQRDINRGGRALVNNVLPTAEGRAYQAYLEEVNSAAPEDRSQVETRAKLALAARLRIIADKNSNN